MCEDNCFKISDRENKSRGKDEDWYISSVVCCFPVVFFFSFSFSRSCPFIHMLGRRGVLPFHSLTHSSFGSVLPFRTFSFSLNPHRHTNRPRFPLHSPFSSLTHPHQTNTYIPIASLVLDAALQEFLGLGRKGAQVVVHLLHLVLGHLQTLFRF